MGAPVFSARSIILQTFRALVYDIEPPENREVVREDIDWPTVDATEARSYQAIPGE